MMVDESVCHRARSSANRALSDFSTLEISFRKIRKSVQLRDDPCGRPSSWEALDERAELNFVWISLSLRKDLIQV